MRLLKAIVIFTLISPIASAQEQDRVMIRCGASSGHGFFFKDKSTNPDGPSSSEDQIKNGKIILVCYSKKWDIIFDDALSASGYRKDGANVLPLLEKPDMLTVGAFHSNYVDIYTFDFLNNKVAWSSNKLGLIVAKVAVYEATCE